MNSEEALKAFFAMESESELSSLACTSSEEPNHSWIRKARVSQLYRLEED